MLNIKHQLTFLFLFAFNLYFVRTSLNMQQVGHVPNKFISGAYRPMDIWGWVDSLGNEYAIVGTNYGTSFFL